MEKLITKENLIQLILEGTLGLSNNNILQEETLLMELFTSMADPEFQKKANYYTRFEPLTKEFDRLNDNEKVVAINKIEIVVNGGNLGWPRYEAKETPVLTFVMNCLAAEYVALDSINKDKNSIYNVLLVYFSPYEKNGSVSPAAYKASIFKNIAFDLRNLDIIIDSYYKSMEKLLVHKNFNPEKGLFDFALFQKTWKQAVIDQNRNRQAQMDTSMPSLDAPAPLSGGEEDEMSGLQNLVGTEDKPFEFKGTSDKQKLNYILSKLTKTEQEVLMAWFKWYITNSNNDATEKLIDLASVGGDTLDIIAPNDKSPKGDEFYETISKILGKEYIATKVALLRLRDKLKQLSDDPKFRKALDIEDYNITQKNILKALSSAKGKEKPRKNLREDVINKILNKYFNSLNENLSSISLKMNKIISLKTLINEGQEVDVLDLDQEIYKFLNRASETVLEAYHELHELYRIVDEIQYDYPLVAKQLSNLVEPIIDEVLKMSDKIKKIRTSIKPFLQETNSLDEDDVNEERITNPESKEFVKQRQNFIGSHIYGEDLGGLGEMYVAYSYGEQYPAYIWHNGTWFHNTDDYTLSNGEVNEPTNKHMADMRPTDDTNGRSTISLQSMISRFKKENGLGDNVHKDVEPGEKN